MSLHLESPGIVSDHIKRLTLEGQKKIIEEREGYDWDELKGLQIAFCRKTRSYYGQVIWRGRKQQVSRIIRLMIASAILGREVVTFNNLEFAEVCLLRGAVEDVFAGGAIAKDLYNLFRWLQTEAGSQRNRALTKLYIRCGGKCEAARYAEQLGLKPPPQGTSLRAEEMHEIVFRSSLPKHKQSILWMPGNTLYLSAWYHQHAPDSIHSVGWGAWGIDLLFTVRTEAEIRAFVDAWENTCRHEEPAINEMIRRLT